MTLSTDPAPAGAPVPGGRSGNRPAPYGHDNNFDVVRFAMAILVILSHSFGVTLGGQNDHEPLYRLTGGLVSMGGVAVDVFFVVSGFLITASWVRSRSAWAFVGKRVRRIYPGFVAALLVCVCVVGPLSSRANRPWLSRATTVGLARSAAVLEEPSYPQAFAGNPWPLTIDGPMWTIRFEVVCYAGVFACGIVGLLRWRAVVLAALVVATVGYATEYGIRLPAWVAGPGYVARHWARLPAFFLAGMTLYLYQDRVPIRPGLAAAAAAALAAGVAYRPVLPAALVLGGGYLVVWFAFQRHIRLPRFAARGDYSYGIYLYGFPIQQSIMAVRPGVTPLLMFLTAAPAAVLAGVASWFLVERPFVRRTARPT